MAIKNASDLLVYAKTSAAAAQVTRIRVLTTDPITVPDGGTTGTVKINNITNDAGVIYDDISTAASTNTGATVLAAITAVLTSATYDYVDSSGSDQTDGDYTYRDFTNGAVGLVPTLSIVDGTATLNENAVNIEIVTPGSSAIFDPVAYSTSASFSTNMDLRDITNKDSDGWSESLAGLKSFEVSTDILQSINPDTPLDGTDFFDKLQARSIVDLSFSDRIRNIIRTNLTQSGVDGFGISSVTQSNLQLDENGTNFASQITSTTTNWDRLSYTIDATRLEDKKITWSFWVKGSGSTTSASWIMMSTPSEDAYAVTQDIGYSDEIISGQGTIEAIGSLNSRKVTGLSTSTWTRVAISLTLPIHITNGDSSFIFNLYPGVANAQSSDSIYTCFWQIETTPEATDYQDPTDITHWQGNALVSSVSFDAGVEDNLTCSASFTGTGQIYPNGLGPELIGDTTFDLGTVGVDTGAWWSVNDAAAGASSVVESGYGKIITTGDDTSIYRSGLMVVGDYYLLTFTASTSTAGAISVLDGWESTDVVLLKATTTGTYTALLKPDTTQLTIQRVSGATTIWLSSISLKKVL